MVATAASPSSKKTLTRRQPTKSTSKAQQPPKSAPVKSTQVIGEAVGIVEVPQNSKLKVFMIDAKIREFDHVTIAVHDNVLEVLHMPVNTITTAARTAAVSAQRRTFIPLSRLAWFEYDTMSAKVS